MCGLRTSTLAGFETSCGPQRSRFVGGGTKHRTESRGFSGSRLAGWNRMTESFSRLLGG